MASIKKSVEGLKGASHSAAKGVTETAGKDDPLSQNMDDTERVVPMYSYCFCDRSRVTVCF